MGYEGERKLLETRLAALEGVEVRAGELAKKLQAAEEKLHVSEGKLRLCEEKLEVTVRNCKDTQEKLEERLVEDGRKLLDAEGKLRDVEKKLEDVEDGRCRQLSLQAAAVREEGQALQLVVEKLQGEVHQEFSRLWPQLQANMH
jgi:uncharacterized protein (DUF3084 family)